MVPLVTLVNTAGGASRGSPVSKLMMHAPFCPGKIAGGDDVHKPKNKCAHERIVQPLGNLMAQCLNVENTVEGECSRFRVGCIDPGLRRGGRRSLGGVVTENAAGTDRSVGALIHVIGKKNR